MATAPAPKRLYDRARMYTIAGDTWPSVTTILDVIDKPGLMYWAANEERKAFETAMLNVLSGPHADQPDKILDAVIAATKGAKAMEKEKTKAATIGTAAHAYIEWESKRLLGEKVGSEPVIPDAAKWAVESWKDWAKEVDFTPLAAEQTVFCPGCGYAGTFDTIAKVRGVVTLLDYKTSKAIYPEAFLQSIAYRHAAAIETQQGMILRLPKVVEDPAFEAMVVPEVPLPVFLSALTLWKWKRTMDGLPVGSRPTGAH
jgi:hypothetical protein